MPDFATSDGVRIVYDDLGPRDGVAVVLCHGLAAAGEQMRADADYFVGLGYRVLLPDLRGHGRSGKPAVMVVANFTIERMATDLVEMLKHAKAPPVHWVGNSLGGIAALGMVRDHAERFRTLTTFGTSYSLGLPLWSGLVIRYGYAVLGPRLAAKLTAQQTTRNVAARPLLEKLVAAFDPEVGALIASQISTYNLIGNLEGRRLPIMILRGEFDRGVNRVLGPTLKAMRIREDFHLVELPGGGHCSNLDASEAWRAALLAFWTGR